MSLVASAPKVLFPTLVRGFISGPIRCQNIRGDELWLPARSGKLVIEPFKQGGDTWCVSHLQKKSNSFSLLFDPFIYHYGKFWHLQETYIDQNGVEIWKPGSEQGLYWRTPGWRWQVPDVRSNLTPWIWSWGRAPGTHLD